MGWLLRTTLVPAFLYSSNTSTPYYGLADFRALQRTKRQMSGFGVSPGTPLKKKKLLEYSCFTMLC